MNKALVIFIISLLVSVPSYPSPQMEDNVDALIQSMSIEKKVGQLFIFGFTGKDFNTSLSRKLNNLYPGSIIVFGRNIKTLNQIKNLNDKAQEVALGNTQIPLFIAVDQEGGKVLRIKTTPSLPSAKTLAMTKDPELVRSAGYVTGQLLQTLGFNMNLAPVVDISSSTRSDFLGNRSFSAQKEIVSKMSVAFARGLNDAGVLPTAKHFPGHGGLTVDSHFTKPYKDIELTDLLNTDLYPYRGILEQEVPFAIMSSHISYPQIDPSNLPATFSKILLGEVLRKKLKFSGILVTDDIQMGAAKLGHLPIGQNAVQAILAGNDVIMVGWNYRKQKAVVKSVIEAVKKGVISQARLDKSLRRILKTKLRFFQKTEKNINLRSQLKEIAFSDIYDSVFDRVFLNQKPEIPESKPVRVYSYSNKFLQSFRKKQKSRKAKFFHLSQHKGWGKTSSPIIFHLTGPLSERILKKAPKSIKKNTVVINSSSRNFFDKEINFKKVINVYSQHPSLGQFSAKHLTESEKKPQRRRQPAKVSVK